MKNLHILLAKKDILLSDIDKLLPSISINEGSIFVCEKDKEEYTIYFSNYKLPVVHSTYDSIRIKCTSSI